MKQIPNFPDYYITETAEVLSNRTKNMKKKQLTIDRFGYYSVGLVTKHPENKNKTMRIHTLMMLTYGNPPPENMINPTIDHINGNKLDNRIENLQWLSNKDNSYKNAIKYMKTYIIECPDGKVIEIENLNGWCKLNQLNSSSLRKAYRYNHKYKGYRLLEKID